MKLLIAGSRDFQDYCKLCKTLDEFLSKNKVTEIVSGTARGADRLGEQYAYERNIKLARFPANWDKYEKRAGYLRNVDMGNYCDCAIIFWDGVSKGTKHMIDTLEKLNKQYKIVIN